MNYPILDPKYWLL